MISIHQRDNFTNNILNKIEFRKRLFTSSACLEKAKVLKKNSLFKTVIYLSGRSTTTYPLHFIFNKKDSLIREVCMLSNKASHRLSEESFFKPGSHAKFAKATCNGVSKSIREKQASKYYSREYKHNKFVGKFRNEQVYGNLEEKLSEFKKNKKLLTFFSSSEDEFIAQHLTYLNKTSWNQMGALKELIKVVDKLPEYKICIRVHPNLKNKKNPNFSDWDEFKNNKDVLFFDCFSKIDSVELIEASDCVVCWQSTLIETAAYKLKRTILLNNLFYRDLPIAYKVKNKKDLMMALKDEKPNLKLFRQTAIDFAYYRCSEGIDYRYLNDKYEFSI